MPSSSDPNLPLISIVIPVHDQAAFVAMSVRSCLAQTWPRVEIIVVDDASTDGSGDIVRRCSAQVQVVRTARNLGSCAARNLGLSHARGEFILFHDGDDVLFADKLGQDMQTLRRTPAAQVAISANRWFTRDEELDCRPRPACHRERRLLRHLADGATSLEQSLIGLLRYGGPQHSCLLYRTSIVREVGGFAEDTEPYADRELLFRILCRRTPVAVNARITSGWRIYQSDGRMTWKMRHVDHERRLALAARYRAMLAEGGLLAHQPLRRALLDHVIGRVYDYACRDRRTAVAAAALQMIARLTRECA